MKKKVLMVIIFLIVLIAFFLTFFTILPIENIKKTLGIQTSKINDIDEITVIDVTNLDSNINIDHEHIYITEYDETNHWEKCKICGEIQNKIQHSITRTWAMGKETCRASNYCTDTCQCGYSKIGYRPCVWKGTISGGYGGNSHVKICSVCGVEIRKGYYLNSYGNGKLYEVDTREECRSANGNKVNCANPGTCTTCKFYYNGQHVLYNYNGEICCYGCDKKFGTYSQEITRGTDVPATYKIITNVVLSNGAKYTRLWTVQEYPNESFCEFKNQTITNVSSDKTKFTSTITMKFKSDCRDKINVIQQKIYINVNGIECQSQILPKQVTALYPDSIEPVIEEINTDNQITEWTKSKPIVVSGTENYCNTVTLEILDDNGISIYKGSGNVTNNKYSISCTLDIEADLNGRTFTAIVTDACDNSTSQEFTISKIDSIPPNPISENEVGGEWAKTKNFTFKATDEGIGNVQIAFNDILDLQPANLSANGEYEREYKFTGDVYQPKELSVLYKDELGNTTIQKVTIDKLDNTAPSITNASIHNNKLTIDANDIKEGMGEGSGVAKYRYITSESKLENLEVSETATSVNVGEDFIIPNIDKVKYIYIVAEDLVGNISEIYEYEVPQLMLTSKVNLSAANGKGGVDLDWSSYDLEDKYFVVYRKQENETEWEKIVPIEQKLTGGKYTDILANDQTKPSVPSISIEGKSENNNIQITREFNR